jgi:TPR repeat protein
MRSLVRWIVLALLLLQARSIRAFNHVESFGTVLFRSDIIFLTSVENLVRTRNSLEYVLDEGATTKVTINRSTQASFSFDGELDWKLATFPEVRFGSVWVAKQVRTGVGVRLALSQQMQHPEDIAVPSTSLNRFSDLRRRAEDGEAKAQCDLGRMYMLGLGVSQDYQQAAKWYERAAEQRLAAAQFMMGFLYERGKGVRRDYAPALNYYRAAADQGHATAANNLASLYLHGLGVAKNIGAALRWYQFSAEHGDATGQSNLATLYFLGKGVPKDYQEAARWFRAAAEQGFPVAENDLAFLYFTGEGVVQDYGEAFKWMSRAAEQGYPPAQINLGDLYVEGKGASLDYVTAYMWYTLGSGGDPRASTRIKSLSRLTTSKQRIEAQDRAKSWCSFHRNLGTSDEKWELK